MEMEYLAGRSFTSHTQGWKNSGGDWDVVMTMTETVSYPNGQQRTEAIETKGSHKDFDTAHKVALADCMNQLQELVYAKGFDSLIEARDYERTLAERNDTDPKVDQTPAP